MVSARKMDRYDNKLSVSFWPAHEQLDQLDRNANGSELTHSSTVPSNTYVFSDALCKINGIDFFPRTSKIMRPTTSASSLGVSSTGNGLGIDGHRSIVGSAS